MVGVRHQETAAAVERGKNPDREGILVDARGAENRRAGRGGAQVLFLDRGCFVGQIIRLLVVGRVTPITAFARVVCGWGAARLPTTHVRSISQPAPDRLTLPCT